MSFQFTASVLARSSVSSRWISAIFFAAAGVFTHAGSVSAAEAQLTLQEAQRLALDRSRQLVARDLAVGAARDMAIAAGQLPDPILKFGVNNLPVNGPDRFSLTNDFMTMRSVGVMQEITRGDKRRFRSERYEREAEKNAAEKTQVVASIQRDTALAWLDLYYAQQAAKILEEQGNQTKLEVQAAEGAYRAGRGSQADVFAARSARTMFDDRASEIQRQLRNARTMLERWIGQPVGSKPIVKPDIHTVRLNEAALDTQLVHHPQIEILSKQEQVASADARLAQADKKSDWNVEVMYSQRGPAYSNMISVGVSIPLQLNQKNRQDRELAAKLAMVEQAKAEREEMLRTHIAETRAMVNEWQNNRERLARFDQALIPLSQQKTMAAIASYRGAKTTLADVLMARRNEIDLRLQALQLERDTARLWAQLNYLFPDDVRVAPAGSQRTAP